MPQLWAMSVALEAQGETVPRRGVTTKSAGRVAVERLAVGQQGGQALALGAARAPSQAPKWT
jgi:hypothetical protein